MKVHCSNIDDIDHSFVPSLFVDLKRFCFFSSTHGRFPNILHIFVCKMFFCFFLLPLY
jgi:hypothetical protein